MSTGSGASSRNMRANAGRGAVAVAQWACQVGSSAGGGAGAAGAVGGAAWRAACVQISVGGTTGVCSYSDSGNWLIEKMVIYFFYKISANEQKGHLKSSGHPRP